MYSVEYINCRVCGSDMPKFLGIRGNREYTGAGELAGAREHMATNVVKCRKCGFVYTNPLIIIETGAYVDPEDYQASSSAGGHQKLFEFNLSLIEKYAKKGRLLDVGCGKGEFLSAAGKRGWQVFGIEPSANFAECAAAGSGMDISRSQLENADYPDNFFDAITLNMVLEHISSPNSLIAAIKKVLKTKGLLFIEAPNMGSLMLKAASLYFRLRKRDWSPFLSPLHYPFHCYGYDISSLRYLLAVHGFTIKKAVIRDSSLRGFRSDSGGSVFEKSGRNLIARLSGFLGNGDVLIAIAQKGAA